LRCSEGGRLLIVLANVTLKVSNPFSM
jgi:hypothetical protein